MLVRGVAGPAVKQLQVQLLALNYPLPRFGADGSLGDETLNAVARFLNDHANGQVDADPTTVSDTELALIQYVYDLAAASIPTPGKVCYDLRRQSDARNIHGRRQCADTPASPCISVLSISARRSGPAGIASRPRRRQPRRRRDVGPWFRAYRLARQRI